MTTHYSFHHDHAFSSLGLYHYLSWRIKLYGSNVQTVLPAIGNTTKIKNHFISIIHFDFIFSKAQYERLFHAIIDPSIDKIILVGPERLERLFSGFSFCAKLCFFPAETPRYCIAATADKLIHDETDDRGCVLPRRRHIHHFSAFSRLTEREKMVLRLIRSGGSGSQISTMLNITTKTVSSQKRSLMRRLNVNTLSELYFKLTLEKLSEQIRDALI